MKIKRDLFRAAIEHAYAQLGELRLRFCPLQPTPRQEVFLRLPVLEVFYGGAAAGGKTVSLLMAAHQYADVPGYHALLLRPSLTELQLPGGLIDLSHAWLGTVKEATWIGELKQWRFAGRGRSGAGGASVGFGYLDSPTDVARYAGTSYSFLAFDELGRFSEDQYRNMLRVLRQPGEDGRAFPAAKDGTRLPDIPLRVRSASNPGGPNHQWVKNRFVDSITREPGVIYVPARLVDNPFVDQDQYRATLAHLPRAQRERLLYGDWEIPDDGELFQRDWFPIIDRRSLPTKTRAVRSWDLAATEPGPSNRDPDYAVGLRLDLDEDGTFYITDLIRVRKAPGAVEQLVAHTASLDGHAVRIRIEQEPGAAGVSVRDRYVRHLLRGFSVTAVRSTGSKEVRARNVAAAAENGLVKIVAAPNTNELLDELTAFPNGSHDDIVDALAGGHETISRRTGGTMTVRVPRGRIDDPRGCRGTRGLSHLLLDRTEREWQEAERLGRLTGIPVYRPGYYG
jgi:predicted phage terminase large subunit-like protein